ERIGEDRSRAPLRLPKDDRLLNERRLAADVGKIFRESRCEVRNLPAGQPPVQSVCLIQVHRLKRRITPAEAAADALLQLDRNAQAVTAEHVAEDRGYAAADKCPELAGANAERWL